MRMCLHLVLGLPSRIGHALCRSYTLSVVFESCTVLVVCSDRIGVVDNISGEQLLKLFILVPLCLLLSHLFSVVPVNSRCSISRWIHHVIQIIAACFIWFENEAIMCIFDFLKTLSTTFSQLVHFRHGFW